MTKEIIDIENSKGCLEIKGDKFDSALFINNELIQFTFLREIGSTWRYQIAKSITKTDLISESSFSNFVKYGYLSPEPLSTQFKYILSCLIKGKYLIELTEIDTNIDLIELDKKEKGYLSFDTYGGLYYLIETQTGLNKNTINKYTELIQNDKQPIVILLKSENSENTFVIDGHHKLRAYKKLKKNIRCLLISKLDSKMIGSIEGVEFINLLNPQKTDYKKRFLEKYTLQ